MNNENIQVGLSIQTINNGYVVTGHKVGTYGSADTGKTFFATFDELAESLVGMVRSSFDLTLAEPDNPFANMAYTQNFGDPN